MVHREVTCSTHPLLPPAPPPNMIPFCSLLLSHVCLYHVMKPPSPCSYLSQSLPAFILQSSEIYSFLSVSPYSHLHDTGLSNRGYYDFPL